MCPHAAVPSYGGLGYSPCGHHVQVTRTSPDAEHSDRRRVARAPLVMYFLGPPRRWLVLGIVGPSGSSVSTFHHNICEVFPDCDIRGDEPSRLCEGLYAGTVTAPVCSTMFY